MQFAFLQMRIVVVAVPLSFATAGMAQASLDAGRDLFTAHCVRCHGADARGTASAPDLIRRVDGMSQASFVSAVLQRYRWSISSTDAESESSARDAMLRGVLVRNAGRTDMPARESQPAVTRGAAGIYEYLGTLRR